MKRAAVFVIVFLFTLSTLAVTALAGELASEIEIDIIQKNRLADLQSFVNSVQDWTKATEVEKKLLEEKLNSLPKPWEAVGNISFGTKVISGKLIAYTPGEDGSDPFITVMSKGKKYEITTYSEKDFSVAKNKNILLKYEERMHLFTDSWGKEIFLKSAEVQNDDNKKIKDDFIKLALTSYTKIN